ncbi:MAG: DUF4019 domain-containing protein [Burkholderiales bacterium]
MTARVPLADGRRFALALAVALLGALAPAARAQTMSPDQRAAVDAADRWLDRVDRQRYADAWSMAADAFKKDVERKQWNDGIRGLRSEYGRVVSRKAAKAAFVEGAPEAGDAGRAKPGAEMSILFETRFARRKEATEEMTMVLEQDGLWRVAGYYIR